MYQRKEICGLKVLQSRFIKLKAAGFLSCCSSSSLILVRRLQTSCGDFNSTFPQEPERSHTSHLLHQVFGLKSSRCFQLLTDVQFNTPILWMWEYAE